MSKQISFEEIRIGDLLGVWQTYEQKGIQYERTLTGVATYSSGGAWYTMGGGHLVAKDAWGKERMITLIDRPKPPLPTTPGTVFRATEIRGEKCDVTVMVCHLQGRITYTSSIAVAYNVVHNAYDITAWEPIENGVAR